MSDLTATLAERGARYGKFEDHAVIAQGLKDCMWATEGWSRLAPDQRQALEVIQDKVARILNGDPDYTDNWHDIAGYSRLVEDRLNERAPAATPPALVELAHPCTAGEQLAPVPDDEPWIEWKGGDCPVPPDARVEARLRDGYVGSDFAGGMGWRHVYGPGDIVAYRLCWIEWTGGDCPVPASEYVEYRMRDGDVARDLAGDLGWKHLHADYDIIAYRLSVKQD